MIDNAMELLNQLEQYSFKTQEAINSLKENELFNNQRGKSLGEQVKNTEDALELIDKTSYFIQEYNSGINHILMQEFYNPLQEELVTLRQRYLEQETDTPREAAENIKKYLENPSDRGLLLSALKWIKTLVPPITEEFETIPYETARIDDETLFVGEEVIETDGLDGQVKVTYELIQENDEEVKVEIKREVVTEMVREIIRVGTKEIEPEETPDEPEGDLEEPGE